MSPQSFWVASVETRHYEWKGYGLTREQAKNALLSAWHEHARQTGGPGEDLCTDKQISTAHKEVDPRCPHVLVVVRSVST